VHICLNISYKRNFTAYSFGIYQSSGNLHLITEWCEHGNLEEYLARNLELDWNIKISIATDIANGLVFCHDRDILHHDIRTSHILLDAHLSAKLSYFELARKEGESSNNMDQIDDIIRYMY